jgi:hypothetical protein
MKCHGDDLPRPAEFFLFTNARAFICLGHDKKKLWVMVSRSNSGLIDGYKERLMAEIALNLLAIIPQRMVQETKDIWYWLGDIEGPLSVTVLVEYLHLWEISENIHLQPDVQDRHIWKLTSSGTNSSKSAYNEFFSGTIRFTPWKRI